VIAGAHRGAVYAIAMAVVVSDIRVPDPVRPVVLRVPCGGIGWFADRVLSSGAL
jgi:hypothetical protein